MSKKKKSPLFIGITGTHCVGKTTLAEKLTALCTKRDIKATTLEEVVRKVAKLNDPRFKIHGEQTLYTTNLIIQKQMEYENELLNQDFDVVFCDRTVVDPLYYLFATKKHADKIEKWRNGTSIEDLCISNCIEASRELMFRYHYLIYCKLGTFYALQDDLENDGFRDTDLVFRLRIQDNVEKMLSVVNTPHIIRHFALSIPLDNDRYYNNLLDEILF